MTSRFLETEVTVGQYRLCVEAGVCSAPVDKVDQTKKSNYQLANEDLNRPNAEDYPMNDIAGIMPVPLQPG